ncbi:MULTISPECIES: MBL fold metallo-hydrolase [Idiomarina]|jgi:glyoxylase-like metal-dependent hydrolase (beta-lactamase superfamily II)|uniref:MBL fold metallo-hydrolase n=1 Tax=Idiomarina TaxID=135575 RepID=UPI000C633169|nr:MULTISPECIES: MBL fold metallo-hydrolase [Idiomarina]MBH94681.1 MBL fold metallo-hydrolase [Idiomarina sp.]|tara:strand:- start:588 stop:1436 length:849 start_codon:yes stop_codon:yes gene_type:complete
MKLFFSVVLWLSVCTAVMAADYSIEKVKGNVYRFSAGHYHSVFMVTQQGIFVTDPINKEAAQYLKQELAKRFDQPIRYLAYSHNHVDHTLGGDVIAQQAVEVIAHKYADQDLRWTKAPTALPTITFSDELTVKLGEHSVQMKYYGSNNGRGSVSMRFMPENVLFVADWIVLGRMPYETLPGYDIHGMINSTQQVLKEQPFDVFVGAHADMGSRKDVVRYLNYLEALYAEVRDGMLAGKSLETLQQDIKLDEFSDLKMYDQWLPQNIEGVYKTLIEQSYFDRR